LISESVVKNFNFNQGQALYLVPFLLLTHKWFGTLLKKFGTFLKRITTTDRGDLWIGKKLRTYLSDQKRNGQFQSIHSLSNAQFSVVLLFTDEFLIERTIIFLFD